MPAPSKSSAQRFISAVRQLYAVEPDASRRWQKMAPLLCELLSDSRIKAQSENWPACNQGGAGKERAENLLFYEDPDYGFVINGLIKAPHSRTQVHDHAHNWTLYGVLAGRETIERYQRADDGSRPDFADIRRSEIFCVSPGDIDLVPPYQIHAEESGEERTVAIIVRSQKAGSFLQGRYDPVSKKYWRGYGPIQIPCELE